MRIRVAVRTLQLLSGMQRGRVFFNLLETQLELSLRPCTNGTPSDICEMSLATFNEELHAVGPLSPLNDATVPSESPSKTHRPNRPTSGGWRAFCRPGS